MDALLSQSSALLSQGYVLWLLGIYITAQLWWWLRVYIAQKYRPYTEKYKGSYAIIVAVQRPTPAELTRSLASIYAHARPNELIVAIDDAPHAPKRLKTIAHSYATKVIEHPYAVGTRAQYAAALEALRKRTDIIITLTPGTHIDETTLSILNPFAVDRIGAVTPHIHVRSKAAAHARFAGWLMAVHARVTLPFQSYYHQVRPIGTHLIAARREVFTASVQAAQSETFVGRRVLSADNESLTAHMLAQGYGTVYQQTANVYVEPPTALTALLRSYIQQYRGSIRTFMRRIVLTKQLHPLVAFATCTTLFSPVLYIALLMVLFFIIAYGVYGFGTIITWPTLLFAAATGLLLYIAAAYVRHLPMRSHPGFVVAPLFAIAQGALQMSSKTVALFSFAENTKQARSVGEYGEGKVGRSRVVAFGVACIALLSVTPLVYLAFVVPQSVPFSVIVAGRGHAYSAAQSLSNRLSDMNGANDPAAHELTNYIRTNSGYYKQDVSDTIAERAHPCVKQALKTEVTQTALDATQMCYTQALATQQQKAPEPTQPPKSTAVVVQAQRGDTLTHLVRAQVKQLDKNRTLRAAQAVFVETTYLHQTGQQGHKLAVNEVVHINTNEIATLIARAGELTPRQLTAWARYAQSIDW